MAYIFFKVVLNSILVVRKIICILVFKHDADLRVCNFGVGLASKISQEKQLGFCVSSRGV